MTKQRYDMAARHARTAFFAYVGNDPINSVDPDGREKVRIQIVMGGRVRHANISNANRGTSARDGALTGAINSAVGGIAGASPGVGDALAVGDAISSPTAVNIAVAAVGVVPVVGDAGGAIIKGTAQTTKKAGQATTHASTSQRIAGEMAASGEFTSVHMNQTVNTITDGAVNSAVRPDVAGVRPDGMVDAVEVLSPGQTSQQMTDKLTNALVDRAGEIRCVDPDGC